MLPRFTWTDRARPVVQIGLGPSTEYVAALWDQARWDEDVWSGAEPAWRDVTCESFSFRCEYGRQRSTDRFVVGAASIVLWNATGWADPVADPDEPGVLTMRPGRPVRVGVMHATLGTRWLYRGFIDAMTPVYDPTQPDTVELSCIDALGEVNRAKVVPLDPPAFAGDSVDERIGRLLDLANWPSTKRKLSPTGDTLIASSMGGQLADLLGQAADSGGGNVYGDLDGDIVYRARDWQVFAPGTPVDGTIGNVEHGHLIPGTPQVDGWLDPRIATGGTETLATPSRTWTVDQRDAIVRRIPAVPDVWVPGDVCPVQWQRPFARSDLATRVIIGRDLETAQVLDDLEGQALYGMEPFERTDLLTDSDQRITLLGTRILRVRSAYAAPRIRSVLLDARTGDDVLDLMTTVDVYKPSRYRCRLELPRGLVFDVEHLATGVVHEMTPTAWQLDLNLDLAAPYAAAGGRWDGAYWDQATWAA